MKWRWVHLAAAAILAGAAAGCGDRETAQTPDPFTAIAALSPTNGVYIGDPVEMTLEVFHPESTWVDIPEIERDPEIRVRETVRQTDPVSPDLLRTRYRIQFDSFRTGAHVVCTNDITVLADGGDERTVPFPFLTLQVNSVLEGEDPEAPLVPADFKDFVRWPDGVPRWIPALILVALMAFLAAILVRRLWVAREARAREPAPIPTPPAHVTALEALKQLRRKHYIEEGRFEPFYVEISAIARVYLEQRFSIHAPELTTEEFIRETAQGARLSPAHRDHCARFLEHCDLVKFARHAPGEPEMTATFAAVEQLIHETRADETPTAARREAA